MSTNGGTGGTPAGLRWLDLARLCASAVRARRGRSALTMTGIAVGVATVMLLTAVGEGVRQFVLGEFTQFGTNILAVTPGKSTTFGMSGATISSVRPLTTDDAEALKRVSGVLAVVPVIQGNARVEAGSRARRTTVIGVGERMPEVWKMNVAAGQFLPADPFERPRAFAVLGAKVDQELFGGRSALGERIRVGEDRFRVIGVMEEKGQMLGFDLDDVVLVPIGKTVEMFDREGVMEIDVLFEEGLSSKAIAGAVSRLLIARHGQEDFTIVTQDRMLEVLGTVLNVLTLGVAAIGSISLLVGAVGIGTIMTIAVAERTGEIGLLRAVGARRRDVLRIFLAEAAILGALGGLAGIAGAALIIALARLALPDVPVQVVWFYALGAFALAALAGLLAGIAPAARAAGLPPVEALRTE
jgi:putative ABC transport system permease protein